MPHPFEDRIAGLVDALTADYSKDRTIDAVNTFDPPNKDVVIDIVYKLRQIVYPGYFKSDSYRIYTVRSKVATLLEDVIYLSLIHI